MDGRTGGCIEFVLPSFFHFGSSVLHRALRDVDVTVKVVFLDEYVHMAGWMNE